MSSSQARKSRRELFGNLFASTGTGVTTILLTNAVDTAKVRWQVAGVHSGKSLGGFVAGVVREEGLWLGLWRPALPANVAGMGLSVGLRYGLYPAVRDACGALSALATGEPEAKVGPTGMFLAGLGAGMCGYFLASPLLQVKVQLQAEAGKLSAASGLYTTGARAGQAPRYRGTLHGLGSLASSGAAEGGPWGAARSLWRGASVIVSRGALLSGAQLMAYDGAKTSAKQHGVADGPALHLCASLVAAVCCTTVSMPPDVVLSQYQSAHSFGGERLEKYGRGGPLGCARVMVQESGAMVMMRGWVPAFVRLAPTCVFSFWLYEQLRQLAGIGFMD